MYWILKLSLWDNKVTDYKSETSGNTQINVNTRVFTMPNSVQTIYNKIMNSK